MSTSSACSDPSNSGISAGLSSFLALVVDRQVRVNQEIHFSVGRHTSKISMPEHGICFLFVHSYFQCLRWFVLRALFWAPTVKILFKWTPTLSKWTPTLFFWAPTLFFWAPTLFPWTPTLFPWTPA